MGSESMPTSVRKGVPVIAVAFRGIPYANDFYPLQSGKPYRLRHVTVCTYGNGMKGGHVNSRIYRGTGVSSYDDQFDVVRYGA